MSTLFRLPRENFSLLSKRGPVWYTHTVSAEASPRGLPTDGSAKSLRFLHRIVRLLWYDKSIPAYVRSDRYVHPPPGSPGRHGRPGARRLPHPHRRLPQQRVCGGPFRLPGLAVRLHRLRRDPAGLPELGGAVDRRTVFSPGRASTGRDWHQAHEDGGARGAHDFGLPPLQPPARSDPVLRQPVCHRGHRPAVLRPGQAEGREDPGPGGAHGPGVAGPPAPPRCPGVGPRGSPGPPGGRSWTGSGPPWSKRGPTPSS